MKDHKEEDYQDPEDLEIEYEIELDDEDDDDDDQEILIEIQENEDEEGDNEEENPPPISVEIQVKTQGDSVPSGENPPPKIQVEIQGDQELLGNIQVEIQEIQSPSVEIPPEITPVPLSTKKSKENSKFQSTKTEEIHPKEESDGGKGTFLPLLFGFLLFGVFLGTDSATLKPVTLWISGIALVCGCLNYQTLLRRLTLPFLPLVALVGLGGASTFYSIAQKFALYDFLPLLLAFSVFILLIIFFEKATDVAGIVAVALSLVSFFSIDLISTRIFYQGLSALLDSFTQGYANLGGVEPGVRMTSLILNPNIYAGCAGIAVILSLGLVIWSEKTAQKRLYTLCLMVNSLGFVLAFSLGATATLILGFFLLLLLEQKEKKMELFILMVETLFFTMISAFPIFYTSFSLWEGVNLVPLVCLGVSSVVLWLCHQSFGQKMEQYLAQNQKKAPLFVATLLGVLALYALGAVTLTNGYTFDPQDLIRRAIYPDPGAYTLEAEGTGDLIVAVYSQNREETMMHTHTNLYYGDLAQASFTVPEDSTVVYFNLYAPEGGSLHQLTLSDGTKIPLNYPLLPGFVATRLQGLWANENAIQRTVFFEDAMKLFPRSPLIGLGLGAYQSASLQVQSFHYETNYVHNHYIQLLVDLGVLGCMAFVSLGIALGIFLWRVGQKGHLPPLWACSCGLVAFTFSHALVEVVWSSPYYLLMIFVGFALICLQLEQETPTPCNPLGHIPVLLVLALGWGGFLGVLALNMGVRSAVESHLDNPTKLMENLVTGAQLDLFESQDHMATYLDLAMTNTNPQVHQQAEEFIVRMNEMESNNAHYFIAEYYLSQDNVEAAAQALDTYIHYVITSSQAWNDCFRLLMGSMTATNQYPIVAAIGDLYQQMEQWNQENMGAIVLETWILENIVSLQQQGAF